MRTALTGRTHGCTDQPLRREDSPCQLGAVHTWHFRDLATCARRSAHGRGTDMLWTLRRRTERGNYEALEFPLQPINTREPLRYNVRCSQSIIPAYRFRGLWAI